MKKQILVILLALAGVLAGLAAWRFISVPQQPVQKQVRQQTENETYVDVRTDREWEAGHLDGAVHFDLAKLQQGELPELPKDAPIALYCRSGHRAGLALEILRAKGFTNVRNAGGFANLQTSGQKICMGAMAACN